MRDEIDRRMFLGGAILCLVAGCSQGSTAAGVTRRRQVEFGSTRDLQSALDALEPGASYDLNPMKYFHDDVLVLRVPGIRLNGNGATLVATNEQKSAVHVAADGIQMSNVALTVRSTTRRYSGYDQHKLTVNGVDNVRIEDVSIRASAASGVYVSGGASDFVLDNVSVSDTRADGFHLTGGVRRGQLLSPRSTRTGDDGVAVVSYESDEETCSDIDIISPEVTDLLWGRGVSVVGGERISISDVSVTRSSSAAVYIAIEGDPFNTREVHDVTVRGGTLSSSNQSLEVDHGALLVVSSRADYLISDVTVSDLKIVDTDPHATRQVGLIAKGDVANIEFTNIDIASAFPQPFDTNADSSSYSVTGWVVEGKPYRLL
jgi:hypothetical protein